MTMTLSQCCCLFVSSFSCLGLRERFTNIGPRRVTLMARSTKTPTWKSWVELEASFYFQLQPQQASTAGAQRPAVFGTGLLPAESLLSLLRAAPALLLAVSKRLSRTKNCTTTAAH